MPKRIACSPLSSRSAPASRPERHPPWVAPGSPPRRGEGPGEGCSDRALRSPAHAGTLSWQTSGRPFKRGFNRPPRSVSRLSLAGLRHLVHPPASAPTHLLVALRNGLCNILDTGATILADCPGSRSLLFAKTCPSP